MLTRVILFFKIVTFFFTERLKVGLRNHENYILGKPDLKGKGNKVIFGFVFFTVL
ncbi:protein of unknown function [Legionella micdadei]|uniref:Uncharacterized protein n=1 Tax=Legionella micdadei TaxID=451 RepID=A0A098GE27_LEGMI|nr:protein of unknown function [Legionella micdadei]